MRPSKGPDMGMQGTLIGVGLVAALAVGAVTTEVVCSRNLHDRSQSQAAELLPGTRINTVRVTGFPHITQAIGKHLKKVDVQATTADGTQLYVIMRDVDLGERRAGATTVIVTMPRLAKDQHPVRDSRGAYTNRFTSGGKEYQASASLSGTTLTVSATGPTQLDPVRVTLPFLPDGSTVGRQSYVTDENLRVGLNIDRLESRPPSS
ncbi:hypothetical protein F0L68_13120 [Solihabitans fulvus]|uniref:DUF2993 domain-containing protein n=1 Tax=Solihabitans fulvus TaxID=1892852 RepID=A0A5B2XGG0_9PSEU|nr:hypothetical protein [Solihabitans fulvus]KAA2262224.1 hypothetical protein F0L68_13120 [Solihabitans fulvus]